MKLEIEKRYINRKNEVVKIISKVDDIYFGDNNQSYSDDGFWLSHKSLLDLTAEVFTHPCEDGYVRIGTEVYSSYELLSFYDSEIDVVKIDDNFYALVDKGYVRLYKE